MSGTIWKVKFNRETDSAKIAGLTSGLGIDRITAILLYNRGITDVDAARRFLSADPSVLHDPFLLTDMDRAVKRIEEAERKGEKVVVYGDYDVDGVTSVSVLYTYLKERGIDVFYHIPRREGEGYGISRSAIDDIVARGAGLMISVDCGITAVEEVRYAESLGLDTVITDHHECHGELPDAAAVVNPRRPDCGYPFKELAGVGVAFNLACALEINRRSDRPARETAAELCREYCDLIAIGTVADVMPLADVNRYIVMLGLDALREPRRPGIAALCSASSQGGTDRKRRVTSSFIGFTLAPKINAAGRLDDASIAVELMLSSDRAEADELAGRLVAMNRERQEKENQIFREAREKIRREHDFENDPVIVVGEDGWHHGVIGIVASRVTETYRQPSIMISFSPDGTGKGSGRSIKGLNLVDALAACSDTLIKFGGHELAAGLSIERDRFDDFKKAINDYARKNLSREDMESALDCECELDCREITAEMIDEFGRLEPYGVTNPVPRFAMCDATICDIVPVGGDRHTRLVIEKDGARMTAMYFNAVAANLPFRRGEHADLLFTLEVNEYMGRRTPQMTVREMTPCEAVRNTLEEKRELYRGIIAGGGVSREIGAIPQRKEFADLYRELTRRFNIGQSRFGASEISHYFNWSGERFVKVKLAVDVLCEVKLLDVKMQQTPGDDVYLFRMIPPREKTNLDKSHLYNRIRAEQK
ncbi:MAG: single-stranded-DNA-specific exonuclease RecJ [Clostridia bacterium]|nr:single-stranded-DNA-specific exonuclease RecJ [Clostridia bacterium]